MAVRLGVCNWIMEAFGDPGCCKQLAGMGIEGIQLDLGSADEGFPLTRHEVQRAWLDNASTHGLKITSIMVNEVMRNGMTAQPGTAARAIAEQALRAGVETAWKMGVSRLVVPSFRASGLTSAEDVRHTADCLRLACDLAKEHGIRIGTENVLPPADLTRLMNEVGRDNLELYLDAFNYAFWGGQDLPDLLDSLLPLNGDEIHLKDGTPDSSGALLLGQGFCRLAATLDYLQKRKFNGWLFIENFYERPTFVREGQSTLALLQKDVAFLKARFQQKEVRA